MLFVQTDIYVCCRPKAYVYLIGLAADDSVLNTMAAGLYLSGAGLFSVPSNRPTPLKYKPAASVRYQNNDYGNYRLLIR
jgi:hypothetical protein